MPLKAFVIKRHLKSLLSLVKSHVPNAKQNTQHEGMVSSQTMNKKST